MLVRPFHAPVHPTKPPNEITRHSITIHEIQVAWGTEATFSLKLKADVPENEAQLIKKHGYERYSFDMPEDWETLLTDKKLEGPRGVTLSDLIRGVELHCKFLAKSFCAVPEMFLDDYRGLLGRIGAREEWNGQETLSVEYNQLMGES